MSSLMEHGPLVVFLIIIGVGCVIASRYGQGILPGTHGRTRRMLIGAFIIQMGGLLASVWTWMIHNQLAGAGISNFCAADGIVQCGSVIGDPTYSTFMGIPWGIIGLLAFAFLGYLTLAIIMDMDENWSKTFIDWAYWFSLPGIFGIIWLVIVELTLVEGAPHICPYCTSVHIALLATIVVLFIVQKEKEDGIWESELPKSQSELRSKVKSNKDESSDSDSTEVVNEPIPKSVSKKGGKKKSSHSKKSSKRRKR